MARIGDKSLKNPVLRVLLIFFLLNTLNYMNNSRDRILGQKFVPIGIRCDYFALDVIFCLDTSC